MRIIRTILSALFIIAISPTVGAQMDSSSHCASSDHSVLQFQYAQIDRVYTLRTDIESSHVNVDGNLVVHLDIDQGQSPLQIPHHEEYSPLSLDGTLISYGFNDAGQLEIYLLNPHGGTPWSTLSFTYFSISIELPAGYIVSDSDARFKGEDTNY